MIRFVPIPERRDANADHERRLDLRLSQIRAQRFYIGRTECRGERWFLRAAPNAPASRTHANSSSNAAAFT